MVTQTALDAITRTDQADAPTERTLDAIREGLTPADALTGGTRGHYLGRWQGAIDQLADALRDGNLARCYLPTHDDAATYRKAVLELEATGANAEQRRANLVIALQDDEQYQIFLHSLRATEVGIREADARASVARNHIRWFAAIVGERVEA